MKYDSIAILVKIASLEFDKVSNQILSPYDGRRTVRFVRSILKTILP